MAAAARAGAASTERASVAQRTLADLATSSERQASAVASDPSSAEGGMRSWEQGRGRRACSPLTPALSPSRGEGDTPNALERPDAALMYEAPIGLTDAGC